MQDDTRKEGPGSRSETGIESETRIEKGYFGQCFRDVKRSVPRIAPMTRPTPNARGNPTVDENVQRKNVTSHSELMPTATPQVLVASNHTPPANAPRAADTTTGNHRLTGDMLGGGAPPCE
jgi:hypothetical protein